MSGTFEPDLGDWLYRLLPEVYRTRDRSDGPAEDGHLRAYMAACGELLDRVYRTVEQRLADSFADVSPDGRACQDWLLPYMAALFDARLVSPDSDGRRAEVGNAIAWRQRKGTVAVIEAIAEAVGQFEVEVSEGFARVIVTPRIGTALVPAKALGYASEPPPAPSFAALPASIWARHPGLPAATVDFRCPSRAVAAERGTPTSKSTRFAGIERVWRQASAHGAPCFPGSYEDASRRTVDIRTPDYGRGHHHPKRLLLHLPPPEGFFVKNHAPRSLRVKDWNLPGTTVGYQRVAQGLHGMRFPLAAPESDASPGRKAVLRVEKGTEKWLVPMVIRRSAGDELVLEGPPPPQGLIFPRPGDEVTLEIRDRIAIDWADRLAPVNRLLFAEDTAKTGAGHPVRVFRNATADLDWAIPVHIQGSVDRGTPGSPDPLTGEDSRFFDLIFEDDIAIHSGRALFLNCAVKKVETSTVDIDDPVLGARSCLFEDLQAQGGLIRLEYCTILAHTVALAVQASDCIFLGGLRRHPGSGDEPASGCLRYSRIDPDQGVANLSTFRNTRAPAFMFSKKFLETGCGVLHPSAPDSVRFGGEDGGEMGAYHQRGYCLRERAVMEKLADYLPLGMEAVLIPDPRLWELPP